MLHTNYKLRTKKGKPGSFVVIPFKRYENYLNLTLVWHSLVRAIPFEKVVEGVSDAPKKKCRGVVWELFRYHCGVVCKNV